LSGHLAGPERRPQDQSRDFAFFVDFLAGWSIWGWDGSPGRRILCKTLVMKQYTFSLLIALAALSFVHPTAFHTYASFKGKKQGQLKGESTKGREKDGWFEIQSIDMGAEVPVDPKSGAASGKRQHKPLVITKEVDAASPLLLNAHVINEAFETVIIQTVDDTKKVAKTVTLKNALISEIKKNGKLESISFDYEEIMTQQ
jgi:type VI secretion system secreted protein Hcp